MKGYKVFNPDWTCRGFKYEAGQVYEMNEKPICCNRGFHFCEKASDCFQYYKFDLNNKVAEVEAFGDIDTDGTKSCTNKIKIVREIPWIEVLTIVNEGKECTGLCNSGNHNSGDFNSGDCNSGDCNSGNHNSGDCNSGNHNSGNCNSGDCNSGNHNSGNCNSGDCNSGNHNSGDWNKSSFNNGCFNTVEPTIMMFNKPSEITYQDWRKSDVKYLLNQIPKDVVEWIWSDNMTDEEKVAHPEHETTGGYLKVLDESECSQIWWDGLTNSQKEIIKSMPNFNESIFEEITGIKIDNRRQAVLKEIPKLWNSNGDKDYCMETLRDFVTELPPVTPTQNWIPVSERLPKPYTFVNATCRSLVDDRENWVVETIYSPIPKEFNEQGYSDWGNIPILNWGKAEVIAWMERKIPEPYKEEGEE